MANAVVFIGCYRRLFKKTLYNVLSGSIMTLTPIVVAKSHAIVGASHYFHVDASFEVYVYFVDEGLLDTSSRKIKT